jgi:pyruvate kinase
VVSKIEKLQALNNLKRIVKADEGIMVARGGLGLEKLPVVQR